ncbi:DNA repair protein RecN [Idiomarina abyssalis]|jgi:DNA repair protein RecN (Recombination protein N)|uniref:DNA repair protein RecN n=2 Tax=Idiomarina abyssalis TaxID=86102 RepID=UPI001C93ED8A|nr:DNA repair protein RecN [Idiomarina abyssalis]QZN91723.1 DNA repair protein RecN [Idiomarina abyssalis]|tara:strand:+ start:3076 stop:4740 length:1665 start_codon:yes stop_codon:yes gene_type:complete
MLSQLTVRNFAVVKSLDIEFHNGMTAITGETGAGKSIALDALSLCLGSRADANWVRPGQEKAEISAVFTLAADSPAYQWLISNEFDTDEDCVLRRVIQRDGRSKAWINGTPVPLSQQKSLAPLLVNIHGQHEHQLLLKEDHQLSLLDSYARHQHLLDKVQEDYRNWASVEKQYQHYQQQKEELEAQRQLLEYQVNELNEFALTDGEFEELDQKHKRLSNSKVLLEAGVFALNALYEGEHNNAAGLVQSASQRLEEAAEMDTALTPINQLLQQAKVHIEEAALELRQYQDDLELDPGELQVVEERLSTAINLAKKHQIPGAELSQQHKKLIAELNSLEQAGEHAEQLDEERQQARKTYRDSAQKLSNSREQAAKELSQKISQSMHELNMPHGRFVIQVEHDASARATRLGTDQVDFLVTTNPGQPIQSLNKVASGGELSRISLAIQVMTATQKTVPTMMFDEVDVGVSGPTAAIVGSMLQKLGKTSQVICVTHLPQVAAKAHHQLQVSKTTDGAETETAVTALSNEQRVIELARLLGGDKVTDMAKANAKELLAS